MMSESAMTSSFVPAASINKSIILFLNIYIYVYIFLLLAVYPGILLWVYGASKPRVIADGEPPGPTPRPTVEEEEARG